MYTPPPNQQPPSSNAYGNGNAYGNPLPPGYAPGYGPPPRAASKWGPSSMGMEPNVTAGLAYLIGILSFIFLILEKENRFARFHCIQSLLLRAVTFVVSMVWLVVFFVALVGLSAASASNPDSAANSAGAGLGLLFLCYGVIVLADLAGTIWGTVAGFSGRMVKFPIIGGMAERWAGGPVVPVAPTAPYTPYAPPPPPSPPAY